DDEYHTLFRQEEEEGGGGGTNGTKGNANDEQGNSVRDSGAAEDVPTGNPKQHTDSKEDDSIRWIPSLCRISRRRRRRRGMSKGRL
ncbi:hypothetical protein PIB30_055090, partial [Stylosanthes scabra]|nr:hypothetical protein [Stylosanthes scabra]